MRRWETWFGALLLAMLVVTPAVVIVRQVGEQRRARELQRWEEQEKARWRANTYSRWHNKGRGHRSPWTASPQAPPRASR